MWRALAVTVGLLLAGIIATAVLFGVASARGSLGYTFQGGVDGPLRVECNGLSLDGRRVGVARGGQLFYYELSPTWSVPFPAVAAAAALCPVGWAVIFWRGRRWWRRIDRVCHRCGYDLRATPGRCPECGRVPE